MEDVVDMEDDDDDAFDDVDKMPDRSEGEPKISVGADKPEPSRKQS